MKFAPLGMTASIAAISTVQAFASGWDCSSVCIGIRHRSERPVYLGEPQVTVGVNEATRAEAFRMLEDSCSREGRLSIRTALKDGPESACQEDTSVPNNDPPTVDDNFVPPSSIGGG